MLLWALSGSRRTVVFILNQEYNQRVARTKEYDEHLHPLLAKLFFSQGGTIEDFAEYIGKAKSTVYKWQTEEKTFSDAIKEGKQTPDDMVQSALLKRALGYHEEDVKIFMPAGAEEPVYAPYIKKIQPDVTAIIFWLVNRRREEWKRNPEPAEGGDMAEAFKEIAKALRGEK